ncbi:protein kinase, ATP binding site-containing protein [Tanacetum coccineum]
MALKDINSTTNNFADENCIGRGWFGKVYKGEIFHSKGKMLVALKRLDRAFGQGDPEFWKEIMMLSLYKHTNIVSLLGYCDDCEEKILVYEYAPKESVDRYLNSNDLTWVRHLELYIWAARGQCESRVSKSERGGKKNNINKHDEQLAGKKINTNGLFGLGFGSDFPPLVDDTGTIHVQDGGLNDVNTVTWGACNTGSIPVTNVAKENKGFAVNAIPTVDDGTAMSSAKLDTADSIPLTLTSAGPMLLNKANLRKLDANVPIDSDFDIWLSLDSVNEGKSSYARILIKIDASNGFCENLVMAVPNLDGPGYRKEKIHVEYE